jgi:hypothetical protein
MIFERRSLRAFLLLLLSSPSAGLGCGSSNVVPPLWLGRPGDALPASTASNVFWIEASVNGDPGPQVIVDTGAPIALLHVEAFNGAVPLGPGRVATLTLGGTTIWKAPTVGDHVARGQTLAPDGRLDGGLLGFTIFGQFETSFNYRDKQVVVGAAPPPDGLMAPLVVPFSIEGGGAGPVSAGGEIIRYPASRVTVSTTVEGRALNLLLDTGASWVGLRSDVFGTIVQDGRRQLTMEATLAQGATSTSVARLRTVSVSGEEVSGPVAASAATVDGLLEHLSVEVGHRIDGLLGAPYLREFYVAVDYPNRTLRLHRYPNRAHVLDDYRRVGIELSAGISPLGNTYNVHRVYPGTDAATKGIQVDDPLVAIDGQFLSGLDPAAADRLLLGDVGTSRQLQFPSRALDVLVDELLPLP